MDVFDLVAKISLDTSEYDSGLDSASQKTKSFGSKMGSALKTAGKVGAVAIGAVGAAGAAMTKSIISGTKELAEYGDNIDKMSQKMGISAQAYQEWDAVMQHSGTSIDSMQRGMTTLAKQAENSAEEFEKLGISQEELASMSQEELFAKTIEGLQNMESGTERTVLAQKLLGGSAKELGALLNTSAAETQAMKDRVRELGGVMSDEAVKASAKFQDNVQDLKTAISGVKRSVTADFLPATNNMLEGFTKLIAGEKGAEEQIDKGIDQFIESFEQIGDKIAPVLEKVIDTAGRLLAKLLPKLGEKLPQIIEKILPNLLTAVTGLINSIAQRLPEIIRVLLPPLVKALIQIVAELAKNLPAILSALGEAILTALGELIMSIFDALEEYAPGLVAFFKNAWEAIKAVFKGVGKFFKGVWDAIKAVFKVVKDVLGGFFEGAWNAIKAVWDTVAGFFEGVWDAIKAVFQAVIDFFSGIFGGASDAVEGAFSGIIDFFQGIWDGISGIFSGVAEFFGGVFGGAVDLITGAFSGIVDFFGGIWSGIKGVFSGVADWFSSTFGAAANAVKSAFASVTETVDATAAGVSVVSGYQIKKRSGGGMPSNIPKHADGGVFYKPTLGIFGEAGAEAVVPLDQNRKWIKAVTNELASQMGNVGLASADGGDIIIPVYIGQNRIDEIIVSAQQRMNYRSGGRA